MAKRGRKPKYTYELEPMDMRDFAVLIIKSGRKRLFTAEERNPREDIVQMLRDFVESDEMVAEVKTEAPLNSVVTMFSREVKGDQVLYDSIELHSVDKRLFVTKHDIFKD